MGARRGSLEVKLVGGWIRLIYSYSKRHSCEFSFGIAASGSNCSRLMIRSSKVLSLLLLRMVLEEPFYSYYGNDISATTPGAAAVQIKGS